MKTKPDLSRRIATYLLKMLALAVVVNAGVAQASFIRLESEINTNGSIMAFYNYSTSELSIDQIVVELGTGAVFDLADTTVTLASTSAQKTIVVSHFATPWTASNTDAQVGLTTTLAASFSADRRKATFNFTNFTPGKKWGVFVDFDTPASSSATPGGSQMNGLKVSMTSGATTMSTSCTDPYSDECHPASFGGGTGKKSFPSSLEGDINDTPEPMTSALMGSGLVAMYLAGRRRRSARTK